MTDRIELADVELADIELADVVRQFGDQYEAKHGAFIMPSQRKAMQDIAACQTEALGGRRYKCNDCDKDFWHYHGCRNRSYAHHAIRPGES